MRRLTVAVAAFTLAGWLWTRISRWAHRWAAVYAAEQHLRKVHA